MLDLGHLKGRIGEALVESIFRLAGYRVARLGRESQVHRLLKTGIDEFLPDFLVWRPEPSAGRNLHRLLTVEVKYRADLDGFLRVECANLLADAKEHWNDLYFVLVTDRPADGRSCFQVISLADYTPGTEPTTVDLEQIEELDIYRSTVEDHAALLRNLCAALPSPRRPARRVARGISQADPQRLSRVVERR